jgi:hypothetical protein
MTETIHEQIAQWIAAALDGKQDADATLTLRAVRPKILDWTVEDFQHGDVVIEAEGLATESRTTVSSRTEKAALTCYGIIRELPADTVADADTVVSRMIKTIRSLLLAGNSAGTACGGLAVSIDCPKVDFEIMAGGLVADVTVSVTYRTALKDGYTQA